MGSEWVDKECQSCSVQIVRSSISLNSERRPLLLLAQEETSIYPNFFFIIILFLFFFVGIGIGTYLLISEGTTETPIVFSVISRSEWKAQETTEMLLNLESPVTKVLLVQTNTPPCTTKNTCIKTINWIQEQQMINMHEPDITYNFLVAGDGNVYEGRGWDYQCNIDGYIDKDTITIALLGSFEDVSPPEHQLKLLRILLQEAIDEGYLSRCYSVIIRENRTQSQRIMIDIAAQLQSEIQQQMDYFKCRYSYM